jgi:hypothetical protein
MTWQDFINLTNDYGPIAATITIVFVAFMVLRKTWPAINKTVQVINEIAELPQTINAIEKEIQTIKSEVLPNGGSSLRDAVNRTEHQIKQVVLIIAKHEKEIQKIKTH